MLVWLTLSFYYFCGFRSVAVNSVCKLQFLKYIFIIYNHTLSHKYDRPISEHFNVSCTRIYLDRSAPDRVSPRSTPTCCILSWSVHFVALLKGEKSRILLYFQLCHFAMAPPSVVQTKLNGGCTSTNIPFPMIPRSFPHSNALVAKCVHKLCHWKSVTYKKVGIFRLLAAWDDFRPPPNLTWW